MGVHRGPFPTGYGVHYLILRSQVRTTRSRTTHYHAPASRLHRPLPAVCLQVELDRFDLFHSHLFLSHGGGGGSKSLGLLFHAAEYPARCAAFPYHLGYCQANSTLEYEERAMDLRNIVYYQARFPQASMCAASSADTIERSGWSLACASIACARTC